MKALPLNWLKWRGKSVPKDCCGYFSHPLDVYEASPGQSPRKSPSGQSPSNMINSKNESFSLIIQVFEVEQCIQSILKIASILVRQVLNAFCCTVFVVAFMTDLTWGVRDSALG